jgi:hypothetical protein
MYADPGLFHHAPQAEAWACFSESDRQIHPVAKQIRKIVGHVANEIEHDRISCRLSSQREFNTFELAFEFQPRDHLFDKLPATQPLALRTTREGVVNVKKCLNLAA